MQNHRKVRFVVVFWIVGVLMFAPTALSLAAVPIVPCDGPDCQACSVIELGNRLIAWFVGIMASICGIALAVAGFKMVTAGGSSEAISSARSMLTNVIIGFIILLSSWLIIDTIMKMFLDPKLFGTEGKYGPWNEIKCVAQPGGQTTTTSTPGTTPLLPGQLTDASARAQLEAAGIRVNKTAAQGTSLEGINAATIQDAIDLKKACNCDITITAGTESTGGHTPGAVSHGSGNKYDMSMSNNLLNSFIEKYPNIGTRSDGAVMYRNPSTGVIYAKETSAAGGPHWDVTVPSPK